MDLVGWGWTRDEVCFDAEVGSGFEEGCVRGFGEDTGRRMSAGDISGVLENGLHLRLRDTPFCVSFLPCTQASHEYRLCATARRDACCSLWCMEQRQNLYSRVSLKHIPPSHSIHTIATISASIFLTPGNTSG